MYCLRLLDPLISVPTSWIILQLMTDYGQFYKIIQFTQKLIAFRIYNNENNVQNQKDVMTIPIFSLKTVCLRRRYPDFMNLDYKRYLINSTSC